MSVVSFLYLLLAFAWPQMLVSRSDWQEKPITVNGYTMGTTYNVTYFDPLQRDFQISIDSLLTLVNRAINTYDPFSEVSMFNKSKRGIGSCSFYFQESLKKSLEVAALSEGAFDPTIFPLVNAWGFGPDKTSHAKTPNVDSLRKIIGYWKITVTRDSVKKTDPHVQLDFGGIGQGYGADIIARFLKLKGVEHFLVELGGEGIASGKNLLKRDYWKVGILDPSSTRDDQFFKAYVTLRNQSFTTAGNYFNYRIVEGKKHGHTIDPGTGYPTQHNLLSASVFAGDCSTADAWDTAFMTMGVENSIAYLKSHQTMEALLIFSTAEGEIATFVTPGLKEFIVIEP